ncbi:Aste57867_17421 [Aphanomyces stellatus]|uniref:Aste57867_17421 protein n=1 Tax=Aphanomyces stellatus TaxID=120398 RepID=A0A485L7V3_9STRA|nr:hypothetical protein As57867_017361 [Aphanomyces stellatus]VFT94177.1 Aste57867_17421 [Aphanomyces stellatus]
MVGRTLPLPVDFFTCPPLEPLQIEHIKAVARRVTLEVVDCATSDGPITWSLVSDEKLFKVYLGTDATAPPTVTSWLAESSVRASLDELQHMLYCDSTDAFREYLQTFYDEIKDGLRLYDVVTPTQANARQFVGVNWVVQDAPAKGLLVKPRDWCYVESQQDVLIDGKRAWVRAFRSIELPCCPDLQASHGFIRAAHYRTGLLYMETDTPGVLRVLQLNQLDLKGDLRQSSFGDYVLQFALKKRYKAMANRLERALVAYRLSMSRFAVMDELVERPSGCHLCQKKFGLLHRSSQCRKCAKFICKSDSCSAKWDLVVEGERSQHRICTFCMLAPDAKAMKQAASVGHRRASVSTKSKKKPNDRGSLASSMVSTDEVSAADMDTWRSTIKVDLAMLDSIPRPASVEQPAPVKAPAIVLLDETTMRDLKRASVRLT